MGDRTAEQQLRVRDAVAEDWPLIWPFWHEIVAAGDTYAWDPDADEDAARALWMAPGARVFVVEDPGAPAPADRVVASAYVRPNYGGPARTVANAGFMVSPAHAGRGIGRLLAGHVLDEARRDGYTAMVFNAVVETNPALRLWQSLGFTILGTVPRAFAHPLHGPVGLHILHRFL
ncbi:GNAT family N-acetyltransferase [Streptomyces sp. NPDC048604]|uniref:GNAT family N-acetyltransferase n=1 Tax=Streptomyces sp. NPDC048604 TaxID=3365578 RepID=UPI00371D9DDA